MVMTSSRIICVTMTLVMLKGYVTGEDKHFTECVSSALPSSPTNFTLELSCVNGGSIDLLNGSLMATSNCTVNRTNCSADITDRPELQQCSGKLECKTTFTFLWLQGSECPAIYNRSMVDIYYRCAQDGNITNTPTTPNTSPDTTISTSNMIPKTNSRHDTAVTTSISATRSPITTRREANNKSESSNISDGNITNTSATPNTSPDTTISTPNMISQTKSRHDTTVTTSISITSSHTTTGKQASNISGSRLVVIITLSVIILVLVIVVIVVIICFYRCRENRNDRDKSQETPAHQHINQVRLSVVDNTYGPVPETAAAESLPVPNLRHGRNRKEPTATPYCEVNITDDDFNTDAHLGECEGGCDADSGYSEVQDRIQSSVNGNFETSGASIENGGYNDIINGKQREDANNNSATSSAEYSLATIYSTDRFTEEGGYNTIDFNKLKTATVVERDVKSMSRRYDKLAIVDNGRNQVEDTYDHLLKINDKLNSDKHPKSLSVNTAGVMVVDKDEQRLTEAEAGASSTPFVQVPNVTEHQQDPYNHLDRK